MNKIYLLLVILFHASFAISQRSTCYIAQGFALSKGDSSINQPPVLATLFENEYFTYKIIDTIPGKVAIALVSKLYNYENSRLAVVTDTGAFFYNGIINANDEYLVERSDTIFMEKIKNAIGGTFYNPNYQFFMVLAVETANPDVFDYKIYDANTCLLKFEETLPIKPEVLNMLYGTLYISGQNENLGYSLAAIDLLDQQLLFNTEIGSLAENPKEIFKNQDVLYIYSSPNHSSITLTSFNLTNLSFTEKILTSNSGTVVTDNNGYYFIFQPLNDFTTIGGDTVKLFMYDLPNEKFVSINNLGYETQALNTTFGSGSYTHHESFITTKWNGGVNDSILFNSYDNWPNYSLSEAVNGLPFRSSSDVRCVGSVNEISNSLEIVVFPNPTKDELQIKIPKESAQALIELTSITGLIINKSTINNTSIINMENFPPGLYILKVTVDGISYFRKVIKS